MNLMFKTVCITALLCAGFLGMGWSKQANAWDGVAIIGDSISTGAATHPSLTFDSLQLWNAVNGSVDLTAKVSDLKDPESFKISGDIKAPKRLWPSSRQNDGGFGWAWLYTLQAISRTVLDTEEYSFGYLMARAMGYAPESIWFAGDNGTKAKDALVHASRLLDAADGDLPSHIVMLYTGNDLCAASWDTMTEASVYGYELQNAIRYWARQGRHSGDKPVRIYLPAFLPVTTLISSPNIAAKQIEFYGEKTTCGEARKRMFTPPKELAQRGPVDNSLYALFSQLMPPNPAMLCPTMFSPAADKPENQAILANRMRAYREAQRSVVETLNKEFAESKTPVPFELHYLASSEAISFHAEDIAGDCFHLAPAGQEKLAKTLLKEMGLEEMRTLPAKH